MTKAKSDKYLLDKEAVEAELERKYILQRFYGLRSFHEAFCVLFVGINLIFIYYLPGAHYASTVNTVYWSIIFAMSKYVARYKGTEHEEHGQKLFFTATKVISLIHEFVQVSDGSLASEEGRSAHVSMVTLTKYFIALLIFRISTDPRLKQNHTIVIPLVVIPAIVYKNPRFGIFRPEYEALAFFVAIGLGFLIGSGIDEMSWRHYLLMHKKELEIQKTTKELSRESRKREMVMEVLSSYNDKNSFFEIRK